MKLVYPALFTPFEDGEGYTVAFPDLPGCVTEGKDLADAICMAVDAASGWVLTALEDGEETPKASDIMNVNVQEGSFASLIQVSIPLTDDRSRKETIRMRDGRAGRFRSLYRIRRHELHEVPVHPREGIAGTFVIRKNLVLSRFPVL